VKGKQSLEALDGAGFCTKNGEQVSCQRGFKNAIKDLAQALHCAGLQM
jgi:hypothetical protein